MNHPTNHSMNHPMNQLADISARTDSPGDTDGSAGRLWPSPDYSRQVERLKAAVGETVYLAEIDATEVKLGVRITGKPYVLLGVVDFPRPDRLIEAPVTLDLGGVTLGCGPGRQRPQRGHGAPGCRRSSGRRHSMTA